MPIHIFKTFDDPLASGGTEAFGVDDMGQIGSTGVMGALIAANGTHVNRIRRDGGGTIRNFATLAAGRRHHRRRAARDE